MIARRKRMLQTFLNRIARHPILSNEHVFHRFLDGEVSWVRMSFAMCPYPLIQPHPPVGGPPFAAFVTTAQEYPQGTFA